MIKAQARIELERKLLLNRLQCKFIDKEVYKHHCKIMAQMLENLGGLASVW